jgi:hypothetical protein
MEPEERKQAFVFFCTVAQWKALEAKAVERKMKTSELVRVITAEWLEKEGKK